MGYSQLTLIFVSVRLRRFCGLLNPLEVFSLLFLGLAGGAIQLVPDGTILLHIFMIVGMVVIVNKTLLKPINRILADREARTKGRLQESQRVLEDVDERLMAYNLTLRSARTEGYLLLEKERESLIRVRDQQVKETKHEVSRWTQEEKDKIELDVASVRSALEQDAEKIAGEISRRILQRAIPTK